VLAEAPGDSTYTVCVDLAHPGLNTDKGQALLDSDGKETPWLDEIKQFLLRFRQDMMASREFADHLAALELLEDGAIEYTLDGARHTLNGFRTVNESKLRALDAATLKALADKGWLGLIYAHLLSVNQVQRLAQRLDRRREQQDSN
jgi:hypothetical protein